MIIPHFHYSVESAYRKISQIEGWKDASGITKILSTIVEAFPNASKAVSSFIGLFKGGIPTISSFKSVFSALLGVIVAHPFITAAAAIGGLVLLFNNISKAGEKANKSMENAFSAYNEAKSKVSETNEELEKTKRQIDELKAKGSLTFVEQAELDKLKEAYKVLLIQKDLLEREERNKKEEAINNTVSAYKTNYKKKVSLDEVDKAYSDAVGRGDDFNSLAIDEQNISNLLAYMRYIGEKKTELQELLSQEGIDEQLKKNYKSEFDYWSSLYDDYESIVYDHVSTLNDYQSKLESVPYKELSDDAKNALASINEAIKTVYLELDPAKWNQIQIDVLFDKNNLENAKEQLVNLAKSTNNIGVSADDVRNAIGNIDEILAKFNKENGTEFTIDDVVVQINAEAGILNMDEVVRQSKEAFAEEFKDKSFDTTVEGTVDVETNVHIPTQEEFDKWIDDLSQEDKIIVWKDIIPNVDFSNWSLDDWQEQLNKIKAANEEAANAASTANSAYIAFVNNGEKMNALDEVGAKIDTLREKLHKLQNGELNDSDRWELAEKFGFDLSDADNLESQINNLISSLMGVSGEANNASSAMGIFDQAIADAGDDAESVKAIEAMRNYFIQLHSGVTSATAGMQGLSDAIASAQKTMSALSDVELFNSYGAGDAIAIFDNIVKIANDTGRNVSDFVDVVDGKLKFNETTIRSWAYSYISSMNGIDGVSEEVKKAFADLVISSTEATRNSTALSNAITNVQKASSLLTKSKTGDLSFADMLTEASSLAKLTGQDVMDFLTKTSDGYALNEKAVKKWADSYIDSLSDLGFDESFVDELRKETDFTINFDVESTGMSNLLSAIKESVSSTGLSANAIENLKSRYQDLANYNPSELFENTTNGIHLNTKALRELEKAYENQKGKEISNRLKELKDKYKELSEQIDETGLTSQTADLYAQRSKILSQIKETSELASQYAGLSSAYHRWEEAQSMGEEGDMYDSLTSSLGDIKKLYEDGLIGTNKFRSAVQLMTNEDLTFASQDELIAAYEKGYPLMARYFQEGSDGAINFLKDIENINSEWAHMNEDGSWDINFDIEKWANAIGINADAVSVILSKLRDFGFNIDFDLAFADIEEIQTKAESAANSLKQLGLTDYDFNFNSTNIERINEQLEVAEKLFDKFKNEDGTININSEGAAEAQYILASLILQKQSLSQPDVMKIDADNVAGELGEILRTIQQLQESKNKFDYDVLIEADTTQAQRQIDGFFAILQNPKYSEIITSLGIDMSSAESAIQSIDGIDKETIIQCYPELSDNFDFSSMDTKAKVVYEVDDKEVEEYEPKPNPKVATVAWENNREAIDTFISKTLVGHGVIKWENDTSNVKSNYTQVVNQKPTIPTPGKAQGTAHAQGSWGTKDSGVALGGEVGQELVVRNGKFFTIGEDSAEFFNYKKGDIIFNAEQTRQILANGKITNGKKRGVAYAEGNAFDLGTTNSGTGSGKFTSGGTTKQPSSNSSSSPNNSDNGDSAKELFDWIEVAISRIERAIKKLANTAKSTYKSLKTKLDATYSEITKVNEELAIQEKAYKRYMKQANSVGLSEDLVKLVQNGEIDIAEYDEETQKLIKSYQEWYNKAMDCADSIDELHETLASLYEDNFNNAKKDFENQLSFLEHSANMYNIGLNELEARGYMKSAEYYKALKDAKSSSITTMESELAALIRYLDEAMASGEIEENSEAWYSMKADINELEEALAEANIQLLEFDKIIREIEWGYFDYLQDRISQITQEADFLISLMSNGKLYQDNGQLNDTGLATMGLHTQNYNVYMAQADQYAKEILALDEQIAEDPYNTDLIARREELLKLQQDSILSAEKEKQAIVDMVEEGIKIELNALKELIDTYKKSLDSAKDLYEYQKKIEEKTKNIASLQKQLSAYEADTSEETRAKIQQLKVSLEKAQEDLQETEYQQFITDAKKLLDDLYEEYERTLNSRLDDIDALISDMIDEVNENASTISSTITSEAASVGYSLSESMKNIWSTDGDAQKVVSKYGDGITNALTTVNAELNNISTFVSKMKENSDAMLAAQNANNNKPDEDGASKDKPSNPSSDPDSSGSSPDEPSTSSPSGGSSGGNKPANQTPKKKMYQAAYPAVGSKPAGVLKGYTSEAAALQAAKELINKYCREVSGSSSGMIGLWAKSLHEQIKVTAYKQGGMVYETGPAWLDGTPSRPETVLKADDTENFLALRDYLRNIASQGLDFGSEIYNANPVGFSNFVDVSEILSNIRDGNGNSESSVGDVNIEVSIDHVDDYNDFVTKLQNDKQFEKMIRSMTTDRLAGGSTLGKYKYHWGN